MKLTNFMECRISHIMIINPFWIEYQLNLFHQGYYSEAWCDIMESRISAMDNIQSIYMYIGDNLENETTRSRRI